MEHQAMKEGRLLYRGSTIDIYPVGVLDGWLAYWRTRHIPAARAGRKRRHRLSYLSTWIQQQNWRAVKNSFNGYLAEPSPFPPGLRRCGSGWTRGRALRDLKRRWPH